MKALLVILLLAVIAVLNVDAQWWGMRRMMGGMMNPYGGYGGYGGMGGYGMGGYGMGSGYGGYGGYGMYGKK